MDFDESLKLCHEDMGKIYEMDPKLLQNMEFVAWLIAENPESREYIRDCINDILAIDINESEYMKQIAEHLFQDVHTIAMEEYNDPAVAEHHKERERYGRIADNAIDVLKETGYYDIVVPRYLREDNEFSDIAEELIDDPSRLRSVLNDGMNLESLQELYDALEDKLYPPEAVLDDAEYDYNATINELLEQLRSEISLEEQNYMEPIDDMAENKYEQYKKWSEAIKQQCTGENFDRTETLGNGDGDIYQHYVLDNGLHVYISNPEKGESKVLVFDGPSMQRYKETGKMQRSISLDEISEDDFYNLQLEFNIGDVKSSDNMSGFISYQDDMELGVAFLPDQAGRSGGQGPEIYIEQQFDLSEDIKDKLEKALENTTDPELQSTYRKALEFYDKVQEIVITYNKHKENDSKKPSKTRTDSQKIDDDLLQWLGGKAPEVEGTAEGYSINKFGEIEKKDPDLEELESLRDKKQQLQEQQRKIAEAEKLVNAIENQGPNLDE